MIEDGDNMPSLPQGWVQTRLGDVLSIRGGYAFKSSDYQTEGVLLVRQGNLTDGEVTADKSVYLPENYLQVYQDSIVNRGDLMIGMSGSIGKLCVYNLENPALQNQRTGLIQVYEEGTKQFIKYFLSTLGSIFLFKAKGVGIQNISPKDIVACPVPVPPLAEQKRIVAKIEELFTKLDAGVEALKKIKTELKRYRQAVLKHACEGKLTEQWREKNKDKLEPASKLLERIKKERARQVGGRERTKAKKLPPLDTSNLPELPDGWEWTRIIDISLDNQIGLVKALREQNKESKGIGYVKMNNVTMDGKVVYDGLVYVEAQEEEIDRYSLEENDILFNTRNSVELVGKTGLVRNLPAQLIYNNNLMRIRTFDGVNSALLAHQMCSPDFRSRMEMVKRATTNVAALYAKDVLPLSVVLPPVVEQIQIVEEIDRHFSIADEMEQAIETSLKQSDRLRQSILKRAFEGKLVPQDPEDEPAERLLERIKVEKGKMQSREANLKKTRTRGGKKNVGE